MKTKNLTKLFFIFLVMTAVTGILNAQWANQMSNTNKPLRSITFVNTMTGWTVGREGVIKATTNGGINWFAESIGGEENEEDSRNLNSVFFITSHKGWIAGDGNSIFRTTNGGMNWIKVSGHGEEGEDNPEEESSHNLNSIFFVDSLKGYVAGDNGNILRSTNGGVNWTAQMSGTGRMLNSIFFILNRGFAVGNGGVILKTTNAGLNWVHDSSGTSRKLNSVFFKTFNKGWIAGRSIILRTTNGGVSWLKDTSLPDLSLNSIFFIDSLKGYAVGDSGLILKSTNGGVSWLIQQSPTMRNLKSVVLISTTGYACGSQGTIIKNSAADFPPSDINTSDNTSGKVILSQNYPNPFNPSTEIRFTLNNPSLVKLVIYDVSGREVETLVNENMNSGTYSIKWDASRLASGIYFYKLQAGSFIETRKMLLVK